MPHGSKMDIHNAFYFVCYSPGKLKKKRFWIECSVVKQRLKTLAKSKTTSAGLASN